MRRSSGRVLAALLASRIVIEAAAFSCLFAIANAFTGAVGTVSLVVLCAGLIGVSCVLVAALRDTATERAGGAIIGATLVGSLALAILFPTRSLDTVMWLGRLIVFAAVGEAYLWRIISVARGAIRWSDARNAAPFAAIAVALAAVLPVTIDRTPLAALALALVAACAVALSLARATEELSLTHGGSAQATRLSSVTSILFGLGVAAIVIAIAAPLAEQMLTDMSGTIGTVFETILFAILLPLGYLAALVLFLLEPILRNVDLSGLRRNIPQRTPEEEQAMLQEVERNRPLVVGGFEILLVLVAVGIALLLLERVVRERRLVLPEGGELERSTAEGASLADTLRSLFPRRAARARGPRDDGSPSAAVRVLYWRMLGVAERAGVGRREIAETPTEHHRRIAAVDARWRAAAPVVAVFEDVRYGERDPDAGTVARARDALRSVETALRT